ncbi:MAG: hypothetical protein E7275_10825 [Pseudobutyrivibrio sp.]|jgi:hypothetical protein|uniref:leucine-rich repeat protein n=1 Tax=Pseudobutyrivibrio sp. TaxID=2014367 RepID=UPI0025F312A5|nr:leucine-rich repeat protein [Pseudobutyrivibrio sp.]MBE5904762.1 hypothetical protein [Pseudobutyrivibrio sp.]
MKKRLLLVAIVLLAALIVLVRCIYKRITNEGMWIGDYKYQYDTDAEQMWIVSCRGTVYVDFPTKFLIFDVSVNDLIFHSNNDIEKLVIPKDADYNFTIQYCNSLREVVYEEGTQDIKLVPKRCDNLETVVVPDTVTIIPKAFCCQCRALKNFKIPDNVVSINGEAFYDSGLELDHMDDKYFVVGDQILLFYHGDCDSIVVPYGIKRVNWFTFHCENNLENQEIYFSESIEDLGKMSIRENVTAYFGPENITGLSPESVKGTIVAPAGSYMEQFCKENNLNFRVMTEEEEATWREKTEAAASEIVYQD